MKHTPLSRQSGFSFIEIMVVVVIIGVLIGLLAPRLMDRPEEARVIAAKHDIKTIVSALKLYRLDNGRYPSTDQGLQALVAKPNDSRPLPKWKPLLDRIPEDPWGGQYQYLNPGLNGDVDVVSLGADGQPGGEGFDADIGSWQQ